jgi:hypothetical protein
MNFIEVRHESTLEIVLHHFAVLLVASCQTTSLVVTNIS